jgi:glutamate-1-semialdehyde aminotransferase
MVRYFKGGGESLAAAVRVARVKTGFDRVISIGYHGWQDWWLAGNLANENNVSSHLNITTHAGVPSGLYKTNIFCEHNDCEMLMDELIKCNFNIAAIIFEYARYTKPSIEWLKLIAKAQSKGVVIIADEVTTGWRYRLGGMHMDYMDVLVPDMVVYGKAISNGFPFSCIIGKKDVMKCFMDTFISSTYWTESIGMSAAIATIMELEKADYTERNIKQEFIEKALRDRLDAEISGIPGLLHYKIPNVTMQEWCDRMLNYGFLVTDNIYLSFAHDWDSIKAFVGFL